jgi:hypothetical protein
MAANIAGAARQQDIHGRVHLSIDLAHLIDFEPKRNIRPFLQF